MTALQADLSVNEFIMSSIDLFLQRGPPNGDLVAGLDELRRVVLLDGVPSTSDGMVSPGC